MSNINIYFDRVISFPPILAKITGSINAALFLAQSIYWSNRSSEKDGTFWKTQNEWEEETTLSRFQQESCRNSLRELGVLEEIKKGLPCKIFFKINFKKIEQLAEEYFKNKKQEPKKQKPQHQEYSTGDMLSTQHTEITINPTDYYEGPSKIPKQIKTKILPRKTQIPSDFGISESVLKWAAQKNYTDLDKHLEYFVGYAVANGKTYANWDQAFRNAIMGNWAKIGSQQLKNKNGRYLTFAEQERENERIDANEFIHDPIPTWLKSGKANHFGNEIIEGKGVRESD